MSSPKVPKQQTALSYNPAICPIFNWARKTITHRWAVGTRILLLTNSTTECWRKVRLLKRNRPNSLSKPTVHSSKILTPGTSKCYKCLNPSKRKTCRNLIMFTLKPPRTRAVWEISWIWMLIRVPPTWTNKNSSCPTSNSSTVIIRRKTRGTPQSKDLAILTSSCHQFTQIILLTKRPSPQIDRQVNCLRSLPKTRQNISETKVLTT